MAGAAPRLASVSQQAGGGERGVLGGTVSLVSGVALFFYVNALLLSHLVYTFKTTNEWLYKERCCHASRKAAVETVQSRRPSLSSRDSYENKNGK